MTTLRTASGVTISIRHPRRGGSRALIVAPGFFQSKETRVFRRIEADLLQTGDVISMDFRGHGRSGGLYTFSALETEDLAAVLDYARSSYAKVGVLGFSYGGTIGILAAAQRAAIDSLVCVGSPMAPEAVEFQWWKVRSWRLGLANLGRGAGCRPGNPFLPKVRALDVIGSVAAPVFFIHGEKDPTVAARHSVLLHEKKLVGPRQLKIYPRGSHAEDLYRSHRTEFLADITDWFDRTL